jgi:hypothetical protein
MLPLAIATPAAADTDAQDRQFLSALKAAGWTIYNPLQIIGEGRKICFEGFAHGVTWQEMHATMTGPSWGYSQKDATSLIVQSVAVYCPKYSDDIAGIGNNSGKASGGNRDDQFVQKLNRNGISIDKATAVDMAKTACNAPLAGTGYYNALQAMKKRYPKFDLNTIGVVMSQGVLAYCPERMS